MNPAWTANWIWSLPIIALTLMFHSASIVLISVWLGRVGTALERKKWKLWRLMLVCVVMIGVVGWMLALLHGLEAGLWACVFLWLGALPSFADAMLYSLDSISTRGESGLRLDQHWRLMGALEAVNGVLLFGISTAYLFTAVAAARDMLAEVARKRGHHST
jgi:hypothetical protein